MAKTHARRGSSIWTECGRVLSLVAIAPPAGVTCVRCKRALVKRGVLAGGATSGTGGET